MTMQQPTPADLACVSVWRLGRRYRQLALDGDPAAGEAEAAYIAARVAPST